MAHSYASTGGDGLFMVVDEGGVFREDNFQKAITQLNDAGADGEYVCGDGVFAVVDEGA